MAGSTRGSALTDILHAGDVPPPTSTRWQVAIRRFAANRLTAASLVVLAFVALAALVGGRLWRYDYSEITPEFSTAPSWTHPMGTDGVGHDGLAQVLRGAQKSLQVGLLAALVSTTLGTIVGMVAGYYRRWVDPVLMRFTDLVITIPGIAILIVMAGRVRGTRGNWWAIALIVAVMSWPGTARMVRAIVLSLREKEFVEAARAIGAGTGRIMVHHLLPHAAGPIIVRATFAVGGAIFAETGLSYLGLGISPPDTSLGSLVGTGQVAATTRPWLFYFPGLFIALIVLSVNLVGDGLRDAFDPRPGEHARRRSRARPGSWGGRRKVNQDLEATSSRSASRCGISRRGESA